MPSFIAIGNWIGQREAGQASFGSEDIITELSIQMEAELISNDLITE